MSTWCSKIIWFLFTLPFRGHTGLCFSTLNRRVTTGARWNKIKISPNNLRANICHCSSSLCSWHHLRISVWNHLGMTETDSNQGSPSWRNNCISDREWVYLLLFFFRPSQSHLGITLEWICEYGNCKFCLLGEISHISYCTPSVHETSLATYTISLSLPLDISKCNKTNAFR